MATAEAGPARQRWAICALLFAAATINYVDRQVLAVLKPTLQAELGWNDVTYGDLVTAFQAAYAVGLLLVGRLIDRVGARVGFALTAAAWSLATAAHALARGVTSFAVARLALGLGESGMFPAGARAVAEHFSRRERALAIGLFNAGTNVGPIVCALAAPALVRVVGWRGTFVAMGAASLLWVGPWLALTRPRGQRAVASPPNDRTARAPLAWRALLASPQARGIALAKLMTDPVWWLYLFWIPDFLHRRHALDLQHMGLPLATIYALAFAGTIGGGWLSSHLIGRGWPTLRARKTAMLLAAVAVLPVIEAARTTSLATAVVVIGVAAAAHQAFSANLLTLPSDLFAVSSVASVIGLAGTAGALGGIAMAQTAGHVLQLTGSYEPLFAGAATAYLAALGVIQLLCRAEEAPP
jgi:ACS family hexuronate transporter-like MFS transporter